MRSNNNSHIRKHCDIVSCSSVMTVFGIEWSGNESPVVPGMGLELVVVLVILGWFLSKAAVDRWNHFHIFSRLGIPGPRPSLLFGNFLELRCHRWGKSPLQVYDEWERRYGATYGYYAGARPTLVIRDLEMIKQVLVKNSCEDFSTRLTPVVKAKPLMHTLVGLKGRRWKELRSILSPSFSACKMRAMFNIIKKATSTTQDILVDREEQDVDILALFQGLSCEVICECALAMRVNCQRDQDDRFLNAVREFMRTAMSPLLVLAICFPWFAGLIQLLIDRFSLSTKMTNIVCHNVQNVIQVRRRGEQEEEQQRKLQACHHFNGTSHHHHYPQHPQRVVEEHRNVDVLQTLLDAAHNPRHDRITDEEIIANSWVFLLGGFETTSSALTFTSYLLAMNPGAQEALYQELKANFSSTNELTYDSVNELAYLDQVICEALRIYPPVVTFIVRETWKETKVGPYTLPPGISILVPVWQIHHDPKLWPDPSQFQPSRFSGVEKKSHHVMSWIPFGAGPRKCVGMRFALLAIKLALARIVFSFRLLPCEKTVKELQLTVPTVTIVPEKKIYLKFERRY